MRLRKWTLPAILALLLGAGGLAYAQFGANTLSLNATASGTAPTIAASGLDANISINLLPKGTGTVQVNGSPVSVSGGTTASLTINPGPLTVVGPALFTPGATPTLTAALKSGPLRIFHTVTDAPTTTTANETLYTITIPANTLAADGQSVVIDFGFITAATANNKNALISFGATNIWSTGQGAFNNNLDRVVCQVFRTAAATQKSICSLAHFTNSAVSALGGANTVIAGNGNNQLTTPAETLSNAVTVLVRALTPTAAGDLTGKYVTVDWYPQGQ